MGLRARIGRQLREASIEMDEVAWNRLERLDTMLEEGPPLQNL